MTADPSGRLDIPRPSAAVVAWGLLRALLTVALLTALYFLLPLDRWRGVPLWTTLAVACAVLLVVAAWEVRSIARSPHPGLRGIQALALTVPVYILLFAATYYGLSVQDPASFAEPGLTRADLLYFTVTTFSSVGFGDIAAASQAARLTVTAQMILNLLVLGAGIRVFVGAVRSRRGSRSDGRGLGAAGSVAAGGASTPPRNDRTRSPR